MFSWFPLYFPIIEPVYVPSTLDNSNVTLRVSFWRKVDYTIKKGVWYEWCTEVVLQHKDGGEDVISVSPIHNSNGRSYIVRL